MSTSKGLVGAAVCALTVIGCGATTPSTASAPSHPVANVVAAANAQPVPTSAELANEMSAQAVAAQGANLSSLPAAPWATTLLAPSDATPALAAWRRADNRSWCAPVMPVEQRAAHARASAIEGGWMVEFDKNGAPGVRADGRTCARCGRGAFGVVGTAMTADQAVDPENTAPAFNDGSRTIIEAPQGDGEAAAATITVTGQGCVYQVWSFLGEAHLRDLVSSLRFVDTSAEPATNAVAAVADE